MRRFILTLICLGGILVSSAKAQQFPAYQRSNIVDRGGYKVQIGSPYYRPGSSAAVYYHPGYSFSYYGQGFPPAGYTPGGVPFSSPRAYPDWTPRYYGHWYPGY